MSKGGEGGSEIYSAKIVVSSKYHEKRAFHDDTFAETGENFHSSKAHFKKDQDTTNSAIYEIDYKQNEHQVNNLDVVQETPAADNEEDNHISPVQGI